MRKRLLASGIAAMALIGTMFAGIPAAHAGQTGTFLVVYQGSSLPSNASSLIRSSGGTVVASYPQIGVLVARTDSTSFRSNVMKDSRVQGASVTAPFATQLSPDQAASESDTTVTPNTPAPGQDNLSGLQWDMTQIGAFDAHTIEGGSPSVVVGDIDTGLDFTHPDLAPNVDFANSVSCVGGVPNQDPTAWMDDNGHGTHTAGTIAAAKNTIGIVGVAPNVKIAGIKAGNAGGFFFPEAVVCAFMWAGSHHIQVTNNSYFADPWLFNCKNDPEQRAIWIAEQRAIAYAQSQGTLVVAAEGNQRDDLAHPTQDKTSPDDTTAVTRDITNACAVVPVEVPGVVGVTAVGNLEEKSYYSSYGLGSAQVTAPGGDRILQVTPAAVNGRVLSTYPATANCTAALKVTDGVATYCYLQGTSMASPHVAGVAALIESMGITSPGAVTARLQGTADPIACPSDVSPWAPFPALDNGAPQTCVGGPAYNSWYGHGQVNALSAVS
jgi:lantibiotic leader peptide-processing serine protease